MTNTQSETTTQGAGSDNGDNRGDTDGRREDWERAVLDNPHVRKVIEELREKGIDTPITVARVEARTGAEAAAAYGCELGAIANSLIFRLSDRPLLIMTSADHHVDTDKVRKQLGHGKLHRADADYVLKEAGQVIGGVSPVGHPQHIETIVDSALRRYPEIWADGGHPRAAFRTTFDELVRITDGTVMDVA